MPREYKIELKDGYEYDFYLHDDGKIEMTSTVPPMKYESYLGILSNVKSMINTLRGTVLTNVEIKKV